MLLEYKIRTRKKKFINRLKKKKCPKYIKNRQKFGKLER